MQYIESQMPKYDVLHISDEWVDAKIEEAGNPDRTERLRTEDLARMEKYIKEFSPSHVYTRQIAVSKPFTKEVRKAMTENAKTSACASLLGKNIDEVTTKNVKFVDEDEGILNFAKDEVFKNASTKRPARMNRTFATYIRSIGNIVFGEVHLGTCFLVTPTHVITNYHVYRMIEDMRRERENPGLPINIWFDYLHRGQRSGIVKVEVDEQQDSKLENPYLDYKIFCVRQKECLRDRVPLGPMVRKWQLSDGRVVIIGHPGGEELQEEVCVVVGYKKMLDRIRDRYELCKGVHMTNAQLLHKTEDYQGCLSYDTTLFSGASGSPVFEMNENIVAMHTQGYILENAVNEHENDPTQVNLRKYSLMEFGVQFISICRDIRQRYGENIVNEIFPNYRLEQGEEPMVTT